MNLYADWWGKMTPEEQERFFAAPVPEFHRTLMTVLERGDRIVPKFGNRAASVEFGFRIIAPPDDELAAVDTSRFYEEMDHRKTAMARMALWGIDPFVVLKP